MIQIRRDEKGNFRTLEGKLVHPSEKVEGRVIEIPLEIIFSSRGGFNLLRYIKDLPENAEAYHIAKEETIMKDDFETSLTDSKRLTLDFYSKLL